MHFLDTKEPVVNEMLLKGYQTLLLFPRFQLTAHISLPNTRTRFSKANGDNGLL